MANRAGPSRAANHAVVSGSCWTSGSAPVRKLARSSYLPAFASSTTSRPAVFMVHLLPRSSRSFHIAQPLDSLVFVGEPASLPGCRRAGLGRAFGLCGGMCAELSDGAVECDSQL